MRLKRFLWFVFMIFLGLGIGLLYGWFFNPVKYVDATPATLREDYKADYILMTAEIYHMDQNLEEAVQRLSQLGNQPPNQIVAEGIITGRGLAYSIEDLDLMVQLHRALQDLSAASDSGDQP
jgi:hypothetical protein